MNKKIIAIAICLTLLTTSFLIVSGKNPKPKPKDYMKFPPIEQPDIPDEGFIVYCDDSDGNLKALDMYGETTVLAIPQEPPGPPEWIYVDDDGGADYTSIQEAIDNSNDGNTIYVYSGYYNEQVIINKQIDLIGENKETTYVGRFELTTDNINLSNFHMGYYYVQHNYIYVGGNNNSVANCIVEEIDTSCPESHGIGLSDGSYNLTISNNIVRNIQYQGIFGCPRNSIISYNNIYNIGCNGMHLEGDGYGNIIHHNSFGSCGMWGIRMKWSMHNNEICYNIGLSYSDEGYNNYWHDNN